MRAPCDKYDNADLDDCYDKKDDAGCTHTITIAVRFLTRYFGQARSLRPFGLYCLAAGLFSLIFVLAFR